MSVIRCPAGPGQFTNVRAHKTPAKWIGQTVMSTFSFPESAAGGASLWRDLAGVRWQKAIRRAARNGSVRMDTQSSPGQNFTPRRRRRGNSSTGTSRLGKTKIASSTVLRHQGVAARDCPGEAVRGRKRRASPELSGNAVSPSNEEIQIHGASPIVTA